MKLYHVTGALQYLREMKGKKVSMKAIATRIMGRGKRERKKDKENTLMNMYCFFIFYS